MLKSLRRDQSGATAVEYGLILSLIFLAVAGTISTVAQKTTGMWNRVSTEVNNH